MKNNFFLRTTRHDHRYDAFGALFVFMLIFIVEVISNKFNIRLLYVTLLCLCFFIYTLIYHKKSGVYIHEKNMFFKRGFFKKKININSIDCIRFNPEWRNVLGMHELLKDETGNILFHMRFYHNYYEKDEMDGYDAIEEIKRFFIEKQICHCVYDKEALDYLLTLNPNIKVVYYDEK